MADDGEPIGHGFDPLPGDEAAAFRRLQERFATGYSAVFENDAVARTVIVLPSLTLDTEVLAKISGVIHYEQRLLCHLLLLRLPQARIVYLTSEPIPPAIVDYYLSLMPGVPRDHAAQRLTLLSCHDASPRALVDKVLERPRLIERIRASIADPETAHLTCFNVSCAERRLALRLGVPIYGCDPDLLALGSKSGSRRIFRDAGLSIADGVEDLADAEQMAEALVALKARDPGLRRAVVKLNEGFSGEGNAIFDYPEGEDAAALRPCVRGLLAGMDFVAPGLGWEAFEAKFAEMGGVVEAFVEGEGKTSPSAQYRVDPRGRLATVSTHDQVTGGVSGQVFEGCRFPADEAYRLEIQDAGWRAAEALRDQGVIGRFGIDFISVPEPAAPGGWRHYAVEINLRKGGTTHPFLMLEHLTDGHYDAAKAIYRAPSGKPLFYYASDTLQAPHYRGLTPADLMDIAVENRLHFHTTNLEGVVFHLIGTLSQYGKLGMLCVADTPARAERLYHETVAVLDREGRREA
ncbi:MAG: peptide ligase PGM1-related protein [Pseudomonadota bacterium]